ncbi:hypothetical protein [Streptomyces sp. NBC_01264]|uniref:hypothetical protein n=1 Tax=Streptomyces sp. NBC_01264 TaxID=2903804 RepID=UPI002254E9A8|nr:hypothetical protein [Streptomyces sp. NBC_01264]MCX4784620.1 hypothetical protein [Streptomyces sp. NBC_01264]
MTGEWEYGRYWDMDAYFGPAVGEALRGAHVAGVGYLAVAHLVRAEAGRGLVRFSVVNTSDRYVIHTAQYPADAFESRQASIRLARDGYGTVLWDECETDCWTALALPEPAEEW